MRKCVIAAIAIVLLSCSDVGLSPEERDFNILFKFGIAARNELNTFQNSYTKDLILDGTITVTLVLSQYELRAIETKLLEADFFSYPDTLTVNSTDSLSVAFDPHSTYYFRVRRLSTIKTLYWDASVLPSSTDTRGRSLLRVIAFITDIVAHRPEVLSLPPARGGYD